jgi:MFS family permease
VHAGSFEFVRGALLGGFIASASVGSVLGVILGGYVASRWGWHAAFGIVGVPGLLLALLYIFVRDYKTVAVAVAVASAGDTAPRRAPPWCGPFSFHGRSAGSASVLPHK